MANNNENKILNVPNLRFPEFSGEWSSQPLTDFMNFKNGLNPDAKRFGRGTKFISVMDILNNQYICYDNIRASVELQDGDIETYGVDYGDILFQRSSETLEDVGRANVYLDSKPAIFGGFVIRGKSKGNYNPLFFRYLLASPTARKRIIVKGAGAQHFNIGQDGLSKVSLDIPRLSEQEKIGKLLQCVDARIATQNKIIEKLQSLIKGLAVALTTKEKANIAISQCLECHSSTLQESEVLSSGLCKVFGANGLVGYKDVPQMNGDAILVIKDGSGVGTVSYAQGKFSVIGTLNYLTVIGNNDLRYLYFALSVFNFQPYKTGMAIPHIYFKDYGKAKIYCPSLAEQKRVANVLDKLESKLFVEQELLASFNQQKLYLLGKMFI
ncbi:restriction endonuclease subunit S [Bacteroides fluxus]|uniref:restriction endonuclease subunit S n=1 Tax=Bacteroides fluxus TaxID=626930 RepID=UPI002357DD9C|nr:restriction endonuclease subunit S [Bacteroides fluxus]